MRIVIDSNILFSALIRNSKTRKLILEYEGFFLFPNYIFSEMQRHKYELIAKSGMTHYNDWNWIIDKNIFKLNKFINIGELIIFSEGHYD